LKNESLVDAKLRLTGICGMSFNSRGEWLAPRLLVPRGTRSQILQAKQMELVEVWREDYHGTLVQMRGRLLKSERNEDNKTKLYLDSDNVLFTASYVGVTDSKLFEALRPGSELEVTGICTVELGLDELSIGLPKPQDFSLLLRDAGDV
jgi:hypothetical protein